MYTDLYVSMIMFVCRYFLLLFNLFAEFALYACLGAFFFFQGEGGIRDRIPVRGLGDGV